MVQWARQKEGGGVRVVLPLQRSGDVSKGLFLPEGGISSVLGHPEFVCAPDLAFRRRQCWEQAALHGLCEGQHRARPFPGELQRRKYHHYCLCHKALNDPN